MNLVDIARQYIGVKESGSDNHGPEVEEFQKAVDGKAQGESWCMAFVQFCIQKVEASTSVTGVLKSKIYKSEHCLTVWNKTPETQRLKEPVPGCLIIWQFANTSNGHVGIVTKVGPTKVDTIEGNTGDGNGVVRNGDGVYTRNRSRSGSKDMKVLGYLKVF